MSEYSSQTVAQLKELLKAKNLSTDGKKADLVQRLIDNDSTTEPQQDNDPAPEEAKEAGVDANTKSDTTDNGKGPESELTVILPEEKKEEEKPKPKELTPEERKQLAVELLQKKIKRSEKFGDDKGAEESRKALARVEKFGVEPGTALAREIGIVDRSLPSGNKKGFRNKFKVKKHRNGFHPKFGSRFKGRN